MRAIYWKYMLLSLTILVSLSITPAQAASGVLRMSCYSIIDGYAYTFYADVRDNQGGRYIYNLYWSGSSSWHPQYAAVTKWYTGTPTRLSYSASSGRSGTWSVYQDGTVNFVRNFYSGSTLIDQCWSQTLVIRALTYGNYFYSYAYPWPFSSAQRQGLPLEDDLAERLSSPLDSEDLHMLRLIQE